MGRLQTIKPRVETIRTGLTTYSQEPTRTKGRRLQNIRLTLWKQDPRCAKCKRLTAYPYGFEIDHITPVALGGEDTDSNRQLLCTDEDNREGCHSIKTREDLKAMGGCN